MANDWLAMLLGGIGGGFTGYGVDQDRRQEVADRDRQFQRQQGMDAAQLENFRVGNEANMREMGYRDAAEMQARPGPAMAMGSRFGALPSPQAMANARIGPERSVGGQTYRLDRTQTPQGVRDTAAQQRAREILEERQALAKQRMEEMTREQRFREGEGARERASRERIAGTRIPEPTAPTPEAAMQKLPAATRNGIITSRTTAQLIRGALEDLDKNPESVGWRSGMTPDVLENRDRVFGIPNPLGDTQGQPTRANIANLGSLKVLDRSGATVPIGEWERIKPFIPILTGPFADSPESVKNKLQSMLREIEAETNAVGTFYGVDLSGYMGGGSPEAPAAASPGEEMFRNLYEQMAKDFRGSRR